MESYIEYIINYLKIIIVPIINSKHFVYGIFSSIIILLLFIIIVILLISIIGFIFYFKFKKKIFNYEISHFNKKALEIINTFGDFNISRIYLLRNPLSDLYIFMANVIYNEDISKYHHLSLIVEIKLENQVKKWIFIEKNEGIYLRDNFPMIAKNEIIFNKSIKKSITLKQLLETTRERVGNKKFYNWNIINNNCQHFIKFLLETLEIKQKKVIKNLCQNNKKDIILNKNYLYYLFFFVVDIFSFIFYC